MSRLVLAALAPALIGTAAMAQTPDPHAGHAMPAKPAQAADPHAGHTMPAKPGPASDPHAGHAMPAAPADPHAGHAMPASPGAAPAMTGAQLTVGDAPAPQPPTDHLADAVYGRTSMDRARDVLRLEHGGARLSKTMIDVLEVRPDKGPDGYAWEGEFRYGGDVNRLVVKSEGEGAFGEHLEEAEIQALYSRAIGPNFDLQAGVRQDFQPRPRRTYATVGVEGLAPYWFEVEGALFLSNKGDVSARFEGSYDLRFTQRLILEPRVEVNLEAQDVPELGVGAGLSDAEVGLRLRYEIRREFAPYVGVHYERKFGDTADFARAAGEDRDDLRVVLGVRAWF
ncbi:copper resistance protein B [Phenylobacterium sp.]|uniref:copper resistance protein B n=1 Tax=Phenylobacterium sp. TaxID=1871053 RepID=UPI002EDBA996